jgi:YVTN family beta-propeller protein
MKFTAARVLTGFLALGLVGVAATQLNSLAQDNPKVLPRSSKSATLAITADDARVVMVNPESDSVSVFDMDTNRRITTLKTGDEPSSVVIAPDDNTFFVANRADATVTRVSGLKTGAFVVSGTVQVGSEPTGVALSPTGAKLFVAEFAQSRVSVWDTKTMTRVGTWAIKNPRGLAVTNNGDGNDADETVVIPEFYGKPVPDAEGTDTSRLGNVRLFNVGTLRQELGIGLEALDSGFVPDGTNRGTVKTSPNQLWGATIQNGKVYMPSISASPAAPARFNGNVFPVLYVANLSTKLEDKGVNGTTNLARKVADAIPSGQARHFLADIVDLGFVGESNIGYVLSRGADVVQRIVLEPTGMTLGSTFNKQIDLAKVPQGNKPCQTPTGIVIAHDGPRAYVNCWISHNLGVVDLSTQSVNATLESTPAPTGEEAAVNKGARFYFTARGRWSKESWSGCGSCHPDGLSDNVTWIFAAGPRQTTAMDGSYSHGAGEQKQRVFNWTGIFDEVHDFERNTRDVSGGFGAVTSGGCGDLNEETRTDLGGNLDKPVRESQDTTKGNCTKDWDEIEAFSKTVRPARALRDLDPESVARGAQLFGAPTNRVNAGNCTACHGGAGWTISKVFFTPSTATNAALGSQDFKLPPNVPATWNFNTKQISTQAAITDTTTGAPEAAAVAPKQVSCVLRNIGTFGIPGDTAKTDALEKKPDGTRAQGRGGFNVPSLYGMSLGAPYLHHGQAQTLEELFTDPRWQNHLRAANPVFLSSGNVAQSRTDLINFILSIDASTPEQAVPSGFDLCPTR